jgi:hypothetical protein
MANRRGAVLVPNKVAASSTAEFSFEGNGSVLEVTGLCVDIVSSVGEVCPIGDQVPDLRTHIQKWMRLANISLDASKPNSPTEKTRVDEFWRTTVANQTKNNFMPPASFSDMFDVWSERTKSPPAPDNTSTLPYYVALRAAIRDRRFFLSSSSATMGLGPSNLTPGDMVCVLLGCDAPTIIRRAGGHHLFVGETYFHGYMDGEAIREMNEGKIQLQKFTLY